MPRRKPVTFELSESEDDNIGDSDFELESERTSRLKRKRRSSSQNTDSDRQASEGTAKYGLCNDSGNESNLGSPPKRPRVITLYEDGATNDEQVEDLEEPRAVEESKFDNNVVDEIPDEIQADHVDEICKSNDAIDAGNQENSVGDPEEQSALSVDSLAPASTGSGGRSARAGSRPRAVQAESDVGSDWEAESEYAADDDSAEDSASDYEDAEIRPKGKAKRTASSRAPGAASAPPPKAAKTPTTTRKRAPSKSAAAPASASKAKTPVRASTPVTPASSSVTKKSLGARRTGNMAVARGKTSAGEPQRRSAPLHSNLVPRLRVGLSRNAVVPRLHSYLGKQ